MIGARLKQARFLAGMTMTQLADELREYDFPITKQAISKYETGKSYPSARFLLLASSVLGVPSTYFTHEPKKTVEWLAFRCRKKLSKTERSRIKAYASDIVELQIELRELLYPDPISELPSIAVANLAEAENAAEQLRAHWDVGNRPLDNLVQTAEDRDFVVVSWEDNTGLFDGLSAKCEGRSIAVINTNVPADRLRMSLAHELGHLVMDIGEMPSKEAEKLAYRFAAALLAPADHVYQELGKSRGHLDWGELEALKRKYGMSMAAWVRRARDLEIINHTAYKSLNIDLRKRKWHISEPVQYQGDEEPLQLKQMAQRAVAEGLMSPDRISRVGVEILDTNLDIAESTHLTVRDLLAMPEKERQAIMAEAFALAAEEEFEIFEANEIIDDYDEDFDAEAIRETT
ncbi:MAG: XRE family transcriptional regulator [Chloroflexota bacterium]|nr:XRE family transcriptional regulator [Chloroflexota bacterium]